MLSEQRGPAHSVPVLLAGYGKSSEDTVPRGLSGKELTGLLKRWPQLLWGGLKTWGEHGSALGPLHVLVRT